MEFKSIDINCDLGEGFPFDKLLMPFISSANITCGAHAGDGDTIKKTIEWALNYKVAVGAHPSFPDKINFGRKDMSLGSAELEDTLWEQLQSFETIARTLGASIHHFKLHGALYNKSASDEMTALTVIQTLKKRVEPIIIYGLSGSLFNILAHQQGFKVAHEVFADRSYQPDGSLTPRNVTGAMIDKIKTATEQVLQMIEKNQVRCLGGEVINIVADTVCIHGDGPQALHFAEHIYESFKKNNILIQPFL